MVLFMTSPLLRFWRYLKACVSEKLSKLMYCIYLYNNILSLYCQVITLLLPNISHLSCFLKNKYILDLKNGRTAHNTEYAVRLLVVCSLV